MAKVTLIGVRNLDFTADDGKVIQGVKIFSLMMIPTLRDRLPKISSLVPLHAIRWV